MAAANNVFQAAIVAVNKSSAEIRAVRDELKALQRSTNEARAAAVELEHVGNLEKLVHGTHRAREGMIRLGESAKQAHERIGGLIPAIGALGGLSVFGSLEGLAHMVEGFAEARVEIGRTAEKMGIAKKQVGELKMIAAATHTPFEALEKGFEKFNVGLGKVRVGADKKLGAILARAGVTAADLKDPIAAYQKLTKAIHDTRDAGIRAFVAQKAFGKGYAEMMPSIMEDPKAVARTVAGIKAVKYSPTQEDDENAKRFAESLIIVQAAIKGIKDTVSAELMPAFTELNAAFSEWAAEHQPEIRQAVRDTVKWVREIDWTTVKSEIHSIITVLEDVGAAFGGLKNSAEIAFAALTTLVVSRIAALNLAMLSNPITAVLTLGTMAAVEAYIHRDWLKKNSQEAADASALSLPGTEEAMQPGRPRTAGNEANDPARLGLKYLRDLTQPGGALASPAAPVRPPEAERPIVVRPPSVTPPPAAAPAKVEVLPGPSEAAAAGFTQRPNVTRITLPASAGLAPALAAAPDLEGSGWLERLLGARRGGDATPAAPAAATAAEESKVRIEVNINGAPPGSTATAETTGRNLDRPTVNLGIANPLGAF